jgi:tRNA (adenine57-N1/adenine58-N1)-methyltransferase
MVQTPLYPAGAGEHRYYVSEGDGGPMDMKSDSRKMVAEGSLVMLSDGKGARHIIRADPGMHKVGGLGVIDGSRLVGARFGDPYDVGSFRGHILRPTPRDMAEGLRGKAQTIIPKDSAIILMYCGVRPGGRVLEVGAGSGGLTVTLCEAVGPDGLVVSYDRRGEFAKITGDNLRRFGLGDRWRSVVADASEGIDEGGFDAAAVDIAEPWSVVGPVRDALAGGGVMAIYVPTTNQLEKGMNAMKEAGMVELEAVEVLVRGMEVGEGGVRPSHHMLAHTAYLAFGRKVHSV